MKISMLKLKNCLGVKEFEVKLGKVTVIQGKGKQGKTSILESIEKTLYNTGKRPEFVHTGEDKAETYMLLDDGMEIKKTIGTDGKVKSVKIEKDGMSPKSPETFLKGLVGEKQLNPVEFISKPDKEQVDTILSIIPISVTQEDANKWVGKVNFVNFDQHGLKVCKEIEDSIFKTRADINKDAESLKIDIENTKLKLPPCYHVEDWRDVSLTDKYGIIAQANKINGNIERAKAIMDGYDGKVAVINADIKLEIATLEEQIKAETKKLKERIDELKEQEISKAHELTQTMLVAKDYIEKNTNIDITPLETEMKEIEEMKSFVRIADEITEKEKTCKETVALAKGLTEKLEIIRKKPAELLEKSDMPIQGLSVVNGEVLINNRPIKNLCGTEKIELALDIAKATSKELKVILVDGLEALCQEDMNTLIDKCKDDEYQYIMTRVTDGMFTMVNEDGEMLEQSEKINIK